MGRSRDSIAGIKPAPPAGVRGAWRVALRTVMLGLRMEEDEIRLFTTTVAELGVGRIGRHAGGGAERARRRCQLRFDSPQGFPQDHQAGTDSGELLPHDLPQDVHGCRNRGTGRRHGGRAHFHRHGGDQGVGALSRRQRSTTGCTPLAGHIPGEFYRGGIVLTAALGAVDIAMWDIKGKALGVPVYELLGGPTRDGIHIYYAPESVADAVDHMNNMGIKSFKISPSGRRPSRYGENPSYIKQCYDYFAAYRNALGPGADLGCELHGDSPPQTALEIIKALEPLQPWFYEEPVQFENLHSMADIAKKTTIPIATGERMVNKWQFRELLTLEAASFLQPDITHCGGITELRAIAALAEAFYAGMLPHCKEGIVGAAASMHVAASIPNLVAHEIPGIFTTDTRVKRTWNGLSYIKKPLVVAKDGYIKLADNFTAPGLGIELDDNLVDNERGVPEWKFPQRWDAFDGSVDDH